jgi:hypothetical protein
MCLDCLSLYCVLCNQCSSCLWIVCLHHVSWVLCGEFLWTVCLRDVSCVTNVPRVSGLFVFVLCLVYPVLSVSMDCLLSSCVLCTQCCQCLRIVCLRSVSCVHYVVSVSGLFVFILCLVYPMLSVSLNCLSSSCVLCTQCGQNRWIVCLRFL